MTPRFKAFVISRESFQTALVCYLLFTLIETFRPGMVSNFVELNYLLIFVLISGVTMVLTDTEGFGYILKLRK